MNKVLEKGIAWHIAWTVIDNDRLGNQIARIIAIVVKSEFSIASILLDKTR